MSMKRIIRRLGYLRAFARECFVSESRNNSSSLASACRRRLYRTPCEVDTGVFITNIDNFSSGAESCLYHACYILNHHGRFTMGRRSHMGAFCYVNVCYGTVSIGDDVAIGPGTKVIAHSNHYLPGRKVTEERITADVVIGNNIFIGANCVILPGTVIRDNVVVGAGSIVKGELESNTIYAGAPCRKIKSGWYE